MKEEMMQKENCGFDFQKFIHAWPAPIVARTEISKFSGGLLSSRYLANLDSKGEGPPRIRIGRKVGYPVDSLIKWLESRASSCK